MSALNRNESEITFAVGAILVVTVVMVAWFMPASMLLLIIHVGQMREVKIGAGVILAAGAVYALLRSPGGKGPGLSALRKHEHLTFGQGAGLPDESTEAWIRRTCNLSSGPDILRADLRSALEGCLTHKAIEARFVLGHQGQIELAASLALDATGWNAASMGGVRVRDRDRITGHSVEGLALVAVLAKGHGTRQTRMMSLLDQAREKRDVSLGEFAWLKAKDRGLWYALANLGRPTFHVEGLAALSHYREEKRVGHALAEPAVDAAVDALMPMALALAAVETARLAA